MNKKYYILHLLTGSYIIMIYGYTLITSIEKFHINRDTYMRIKSKLFDNPSLSTIYNFNPPKGTEEPFPVSYLECEFFEEDN